MAKNTRVVQTESQKRFERYANILETLERDHADCEVRLSDLSEEVDYLANAKSAIQELLDVLEVK